MLARTVRDGEISSSLQLDMLGSSAREKHIPLPIKLNYFVHSGQVRAEFRFLWAGRFTPICFAYKFSRLTENRYESEVGNICVGELHNAGEIPATLCKGHLSNRYKLVQP